MNALLSYLGPAISVVVFLGAAAVFLRGSRDRGTIASLSASNAALTGRIADFEVQVGKLTTEVATLTQANKVLTNTVTGADAIAALSRQIADLGRQIEGHHGEAMKAWRQIHTDLTNLKERDGP